MLDFTSRHLFRQPSHAQRSHHDTSPRFNSHNYGLFGITPPPPHQQDLATPQLSANGTTTLTPPRARQGEFITAAFAIVEYRFQEAADSLQNAESSGYSGGGYWRPTFFDEFYISAFYYRQRDALPSPDQEGSSYLMAIFASSGAPCSAFYIAASSTASPTLSSPSPIRPDEIIVPEIIIMSMIIYFMP